MKMQAAAITPGNSTPTSGRSLGRGVSVRTRPSNPEEHSVLQAFAERYGAVDEDDQDAFLQALGVRGDTHRKCPGPFDLAVIKPEDHVNPIILNYWAAGQIGNDYIDHWRAHAKTCAYCRGLYRSHDIPLEK